MAKTILGFHYRASNGTEFSCEKENLGKTVIVKRPEGIKEKNFIADIAEMAAYHAMNVRPILDSFAGYDTIRYEVV